MKKLIVLAAMAAMALGAMADYTVGNVYFTPVDEFDSPRYYSAYIIQYKGGDDAAWLYVKDVHQKDVLEAKGVARYFGNAGMDTNGDFFFKGDQGSAGVEVDPSTLNIPFSEAYAVVYYFNPQTEDYMFELIRADDTAGRTDYVFAGNVVGNGWTNAIPEPTSGLLMFLGMAGLMLKRKRA